jgi:peptidyl-dipeptidase A
MEKCHWTQDQGLCALFTLKELYPEFVELLNQGASESGYKDMGELWRSGYDMKPEEFTEMVKKVWQEVLPLYEQYKLAETYPDHVSVEEDYIPAHLLGNPWSQDWSNLYNDILIPYPDVTPVDITPELLKQDYTVEDMHRLSESFYTSLGYDALPETFWNRSMLAKPSDRDVVCHASAWDFGQNDLRIKMCTAINGEDLLTYILSSSN